MVHRHRGDKLVYDFIRAPDMLGINGMRVEHKWIKANEWQLYQAGYKQAIDLVGGWEYMGMKVYARLRNFKECDVSV